jgi:prepilin signal peptidase PulO-like enzyme (type II secretory pathway)
MLDFILLVFGLTWLLIASIIDLKTREVPDWISYSMIGLGLLFRLTGSIEQKSMWPIIYGILGFAIFFSIGSFMYYTKQWGGGDAKLLMGIGAVFATPFFNQETLWPYWSVLVINILLCGALYSLFWMDILALKNFKKVHNNLAQQKYTDVKVTAITAGLLTSISYFLLPREFFVFFTVAGLGLLGVCLLLHYAKAIEECSLIQKVPLDQVTEGDWLAADIKKNKKIIIYKENLGLTKEDIIKIKKEKIPVVSIRYGIPFAPALFLGVALTIWVGDLTILLF